MLRGKSDDTGHVLREATGLMRLPESELSP
jgi:hypothetical protein